MILNGAYDITYQKQNRLSMNIVTVPFEEPLILSVNGETIQIIAFKTLEHGNIKFGVEAPRSVAVHREEIFNAIKQKQQDAEAIS